MGEELWIDLPRTVRTFKEFVAVDIYTGDSDPVYWAVVGAARRWGTDWATRFCVGMLTYYHTGTAAKAADYEGDHFWNYLRSVYDTAPRGSERRHFRGDAGRTALDRMWSRSPNPNQFFETFPQTYTGVQSVCENRLYQFGPYFQLKICDYMDRCLGIPIHSYAGLERNLPTEPARAVKLMFPDKPISTAFRELCDEASTWGYKAAPLFDRPIGPAEIETSLCGWKTTKYKGNYFGADIKDKRDALRGHGDKAEEMVNMIPLAYSKDAFPCEL